jgi:hypothetical protein
MHLGAANVKSNPCICPVRSGGDVEGLADLLSAPDTHFCLPDRESAAIQSVSTRYIMHHTKKRIRQHPEDGGDEYD